MANKANTTVMMALALGTLASVISCSSSNALNEEVINTEWITSGDLFAGSRYAIGHYDSDSLRHSGDNSYKVKSFKTLVDVESGDYILRAFTQSSGGQKRAQIFLQDCGSVDVFQDIPQTEGNSDYWSIVETSPVNVSGDNCTIGFISEAEAGQWVLADDFELLPAPKSGKAPTSMLVGGDITFRNLIRSVGGKWADDDGEEKDVLQILSNHAFNLARIRIYVEPTNSTVMQGKEYSLQKGFQDISDAVNNAKAARANGMSIFMSLHYSDFWTNPSIQAKPKLWQGLEGADLEKALYEYTYEVMTTLKQNGVTPEYISIGNEINNAVADVPRGEAYYRLLQKGYEAVKAVSKSTKVVIHLTEPNFEFYKDWIDNAQKYGLNYDILGASMYPFWTNLSIGEMQHFVNQISDYSNKNIMICEVGYPWTLETQHGDRDITPLILSNNLDPDGPENYGPSPDGQLNYMKEYFRAMYNTGVVEGIAYWDPIAIDIKGAGWVDGELMNFEDTSFFDYQNPHNALKSLDSFYSY